MIIRPAVPDDALRVAAIHVAASKAAYEGIIPDRALRSLSIETRQGAWKELLEAGHPLTLIAEEGETALGWVSAARSRDLDAAASTGEIWSVYVDPRHWGRGVGRALCQAAEQHLRRQGFGEMTLWTFSENERALRFYQRYGFVRDACEERIDERDGKQLREVRLRKQFIASSAA